MNYGMRKYPNYPEQHCHSFRKHGGCSALGQAARKPADPERGNPTRTVSHVAMETVVREAETEEISKVMQWIIGLCPLNSRSMLHVYINKYF